jgi:hypothetical protein
MIPPSVLNKRLLTLFVPIMPPFRFSHESLDSFNARKRGARDPYAVVPESDEDDNPSPSNKPAESPVEPRRESGPADVVRARVELPLRQLSASLRSQYRTVSPVDDGGGDAVAHNSDDVPDPDAADNSDGNDPSSVRPGRQTRAAQQKPPDVLTITAGKLRVEDVSGEVNASLDRFVRQFPELVRRAQRWMRAQLPASDIARLSHVQRLLPRLPLGPNWTEGDVRLLEKRWRKNHKRERLLDVGGNKCMLTLYKSCLRLMRCLPEDIIGCRFNLEYDESQNRSLSAKRPSVIWSAPFCRALTALLVHPMWNKTTAPLAAAIQYTVIASTNDCGPWIMQLPGCDTFLARLLDRKRQQPDANVTELRRQLHDEISAPRVVGFGRFIGTDADSDWDLLFHTIEVLAKPAAEPAHRLPSDPLLVHREHLDLLEKALDSMRRMGVPKFMPLDLYNRLINGRRSARDYPQQEDLRALRNYDILCELERLAFKGKQTPLAAAEVPNTQPDVIPETQQEPRGRKRFRSEPRQQVPQEPTDLPAAVQPRKRARLEVPSTSQLEPEPSDAAPACSSRSDLGKFSLQSQPEHQSETGSRVSDLFEPHKLSPPRGVIDDRSVGHDIEDGEIIDDGSVGNDTEDGEIIDNAETDGPPLPAPDDDIDDIYDSSNASVNWTSSDGSHAGLGPWKRHANDDWDPIWDSYQPNGLPSHSAEEAVPTPVDAPSGASVENAVSANDHENSDPSAEAAVAPYEAYELPEGASILPLLGLGE